MKRLLCVIMALMCLLCFFSCGKGKDDTSLSSEGKNGTIAFVQNEITISIGESVQLEVETTKKNVFIFWSIRDENLATVSDDGVITALAEGQTICYAEFAGERVMCLVKIVSPQAMPLLSISVPYEGESVTLYVGDSLAINEIVRLGDSVVTDAQVEYEITQTDIVQVEGNKMVGKKVGEATVLIRATYENQVASLTLKVKVVEK
ncbi:MAG: Ig-like domain-containing protein [Clostridia bacterium]|nr:Ig-like domain-containing protein [Clostridia bacterium]